jgi:hypothetical protein
MTRKIARRRVTFAAASPAASTGVGANAAPPQTIIMTRPKSSRVSALPLRSFTCGK